MHRNKQTNNHAYGDKDHRPGISVRGAPAESFDNAGHRVKTIEKTHRFGDKACRVDNGRANSQSWIRKGIVYWKSGTGLQCREPETDPERCGKGEKNKQG